MSSPFYRPLHWLDLARKYSPKMVHFVCLLMAGTGLVIFPHIENKYLLFAPMTGFGIAWASMMGVPYLMVVGHIPKERYGVYMGIINMMIVIPMISAKPDIWIRTEKYFK